MNPIDMFVYEYYQNEEKARKRSRASFEKHVRDNKARVKARVKAEEAEDNSEGNR
jgi:hypothetical protein